MPDSHDAPFGEILKKPELACTGGSGFDDEEFRNRALGFARVLLNHIGDLALFPPEVIIPDEDDDVIYDNVRVFYNKEKNVTAETEVTATIPLRTSGDDLPGLLTIPGLVTRATNDVELSVGVIFYNGMFHNVLHDDQGNYPGRAVGTHADTITDVISASEPRCGRFFVTLDAAAGSIDFGGYVGACFEKSDGFNKSALATFEKWLALKNTEVVAFVPDYDTAAELAEPAS